MTMNKLRKILLLMKAERLIRRIDRRRFSRERAYYKLHDVVKMREAHDYWQYWNWPEVLK